MKRRIAAWVLLSTLLAGLSGTMLSCKSSAKPPAVSSPSANAQDQDSALAIANGYKVTLDYSITLPDNTVAASSIGKEPLSFTQGKHEIAPAALETALAGMKVGERKSIPLKPDQAFGPYDESKKVAVKRAQLPADAKVGGLVSTKDGRKARIVDLSDSSAVLDFNHPLAGKNLVFDVTILKVEKQP
jgi:FKBP-type peptidyl-prolyl cis-trans isomerase SlyD